MPLVFNVALNHGFVEANGGNEITPAPETTFGEFAGFLLQPSTGLAFQDVENVGHAVLGWDDEVQVDMLITNVPGNDAEVFPLGDLAQYSFQFGFGILVLKYLASVPGGPNYMVLANVCTMRQMIQSCIVAQN